MLLTGLLSPLAALAQPAQPAPLAPPHGRHAAVISDGHVGPYAPLPRASRAWRICALLPHARDKYWWGVSWGLSDEARLRGIKLGIYQAGGYEFLPMQRLQFDACLKKGADAIVLAAISTDGMNADIARAVKRGVPVIDLVNGVSSKLVSARSLVNFQDMAKRAAQYVLEQSAARAVTVAWFPGPQHASWVDDAETGLRRAFQQAPVTVLHGGYAPTELGAQMGLVRALLATSTTPPDYFIGNAPAIEAVANLRRYSPQIKGQPVALYATEPVVDLVRQGRVLAAVSDSPVLQARIAIDLALRVLEKQPYPRRVGPVIDIIDAASVGHYDYRRVFAPGNQRITQQPLPD